MFSWPYGKTWPTSNPLNALGKYGSYSTANRSITYDSKNPGAFVQAAEDALLQREPVLFEAVLTKNFEQPGPREVVRPGGVITLVSYSGKP